MRCAHGHDNPATSRFCRLCGLELAPPSSAPSVRGPDRDISTAEVPAVAPPVLSPGGAPRVPPTAATFPPPPTEDPDGRRRRWAVSIVGGTAAVLAAAIVIAVVVTNDSHKSASDQPHHSPTTPTTANPSSSSSSSSSTAPSTTAPPADRATIAALEDALTKASRGRTMLIPFSNHLANCNFDRVDAELLQTVIANRRQVAADARRIAATTHDSSTLSSDFAALMDQSAATDGAYLSWVQHSLHKAGDGCQIPANASAANASVDGAKAAFVARFNSAAAAYNLQATWTANDF